MLRITRRRRGKFPLPSGILASMQGVRLIPRHLAQHQVAVPHRCLSGIPASGVGFLLF
jgi:hypothetical protein